MERGADRSAAVLAIDPGREKCGLAVVDADGRVAARAIVAAADVVSAALEWAARLAPRQVVVGEGTGARPLRAALARAGVEAIAVAEYGTTLRARDLYFRDHPPRGWRRLVPLRLQVPPVPLDDYAAVLIAQNYFRLEEGGRRTNDERPPADEGHPIEREGE